MIGQEMNELIESDEELYAADSDFKKFNISYQGGEQYFLSDDSDSLINSDDERPII